VSLARRSAREWVPAIVVFVAGIVFWEAVVRVL
jgi:hypothetical protein